MTDQPAVIGTSLYHLAGICEGIDHPTATGRWFDPQSDQQAERESSFDHQSEASGWFHEEVVRGRRCCR